MKSLFPFNLCVSLQLLITPTSMRTMAVINIINYGLITSSGWQWADPALTLWPQDQFGGPQLDPFNKT
jgi:hypothetical protein